MLKYRILIITLLPLLLALFFSASALHQGNPGFKVDKTQKGLRVSYVTDSHDHLIQVGDLIVAVNGVSYPSVLGL